MKRSSYARVDVQIHVFLTSALFGGEWSASCPCRFASGERAPGTHWLGGRFGPGMALDDIEMWKFLTLPGLELSHLGRPARSQALHWLRYRGSIIQIFKDKPRDVYITICP
jgi:hypothetical protein